MVELAIAFDALIEANYPPDVIWDMTPQQMNAALEFSDRRRRMRQAELLNLHALAAQGAGKDIGDFFRKLTK